MSEIDRQIDTKGESSQLNELQKADRDFFEENLARRGITQSSIDNMYEVTFNGTKYMGPLSVIIDIIDGGSSWPAEPMGPKNPSLVDPYNW